MERKSILQELNNLELPWDEVLPARHLEWLDVFSKSHNVVKEIMFPAMLTALSGLMAPRTTLEMSAIEKEPVNLFTIVLARPGAGKTAALKAAIENPVLAVESRRDTPILIEDFTKTGVFVHLKETGGTGIYAKDEVHTVIAELVSTKKKELDKDIFIKFFDNGSWAVNKGNSAKRDRIPATSLAFFGLSQPDSFFELYGKLAVNGNGLIDRILCCCPQPHRLTRTEVNQEVAKLERYTFAKNLDHIYEYVYHRHQDSTEPVVYKLSQDAMAHFEREETKLVEAQNAVFSNSEAEGTAVNISKAAKLVLRICVSLHVFTDRLAQAFGQVPVRDTPTEIELACIKRAFALSNWFLDSRYILEKNTQSKPRDDTFSLAKKLLTKNGPFLTFRLACRGTHACATDVVEALKKLESDGLGEVDLDQKAFFKRPPLMVEEDSLQLYGVDLIVYSDMYRVRNEQLSDTQWNTLLLNDPNQVEVSRYFPH